MRLTSALALLLLPLASWFAVACAGGGGGDGQSLSDRLLLVRDTGITELDLATGNEQSLIPDFSDALVADPVISPDGRQIAFSALLQGIAPPGEAPDFGADVYVADRNGGNQRLLYEHQVRGEQVRSPAWLTNGTLLFSVQRFEQTGFVAQIRVLDLATGTNEVVVDGAVQATASAGGARIAYVSIDQNGQQALWVADADGKNGRALAGTDQLLGVIISPRFSPDGRFLVFGAGESVLPAAGRDPGAEFVSRHRAAALEQPRPSLFYNGVPTDIWIIDLETGEPTKVADANADQPSLAWSGDGLRLFALDASGLFAINPAGGELPRRVGEGTFHGQLDWLSAATPAP